jgi:hypothetical protein
VGLREPGGQLADRLLRPMTEMRAVIEAAAAQRTPNARAEQMLTRFVDLALRHRRLTAMLSADQAIVHLFRTQGQYAELVERPLALLAGSTPQPAGRINAVLALAGIASATGGELVGDLDDDTLRRHLVDAGRRILGLPTHAPRAPKVLVQHFREKVAAAVRENMRHYLATHLANLY